MAGVSPRSPGTHTGNRGPAGRDADPSMAGTPGSFRVARLLGFDVYLHWSWLIIASTPGPGGVSARQLERT